MSGDSMPIVVGLTGKARSGKDTLGSLLCEQYGFVRVSFADPIRRFVADLLDITVEELEPIKEVSQPIFDGKTPRQVMQSLGTEWGRGTIAFNLWIDVAMRKVDRIISRGGSVVVTDVRFNNEAQACIDRIGKIIEIVRPGNLGATSGQNHTSEKPISRELVFQSIENAGPATNMLDQVISVLESDFEKAKLFAA